MYWTLIILWICILDSGHANPIGGQQASWLRTALEARKGVSHRMAIYHVPAYPSIGKFNNRQSKAIRRFWVPLFEKGGIQVAFEHHDHAYKRTHPLLNNRIHPNGVVYLGDGAWGVERTRTPRTKHKRHYIAKFLPIRHFIAVTLTPEQQRFKTINSEGKVMDEYTRQLNVVQKSR